MHLERAYCVWSILWLYSACLKDIKVMVDSMKHKRDNASRTTVKILASAINGESVKKAKCVTDLSEKLGIRRRTMAGGKRIRTRILTSDKSALDYVKRKTRKDSISEDTKKLAFDFWLQPENSRPANNKNDIKRVRISKSVYSSHGCHILDKTQTEVYLEFKAKFPHIKIGQRSFEKCKPFYLRSACLKDKSTCCCRQHVEIRSVFKSCMSFRKTLNSNSAKIYDSLSELVSETLCEPSANTRQYNMSCLDRTCTECGIDKFKLLDIESCEGSTDMTCSWERYEYKNLKNKDGSEFRKLVLMKKNTSPVLMFDYLKQLLITFPAHDFRAIWQGKQMKHLIRNLPVGHCLAVHDYSENYKCSEKFELSSSYFQKVEVSLHVTILYRHANLEIDGCESTETEPNIITEHFIVVSPEARHDHHFTHDVQVLVCDYLHSLNIDFHSLHEFTDGCSCQYKSCHCLGRYYATDG